MMVQQRRNVVDEARNKYQCFEIWISSGLNYVRRDVLLGGLEAHMSPLAGSRVFMATLMSLESFRVLSVA